MTVTGKIQKFIMRERTIDELGLKVQKTAWAEPQIASSQNGGIRPPIGGGLIHAQAIQQRCQTPLLLALRLPIRVWNVDGLAVAIVARDRVIGHNLIARDASVGRSGGCHRGAENDRGGNHEFGLGQHHCISFDSGAAYWLPTQKKIVNRQDYSERPSASVVFPITFQSTRSEGIGPE
jgi:hypothetical protein